MGHKVPVRMAGDYVETEWYVNSMRPIQELVRRRLIDATEMFDAYQVAHGVKMHVDYQGFITDIEFASEEGAVEFVLKWS